MSDHRHQAFLAHRTGVAIAFLLIASCGGSSPKPDFAFYLGATSVTVYQGSTSEPVNAVAVTSQYGWFPGNATVTLSGLPPGTTVQPSFPLQDPVCVVTDPNQGADCYMSSPQFTITTTGATPLG